jgi:hypothetical protein
MGRTIEIQAASLWAAKEKAKEILRPRKSQEGLLAVVLVALDGKSVEIDGASL